MFSFTSEVDYVVKGGEVERRHNVVSIQNPGGVHQTHELQHLVLWSGWNQSNKRIQHNRAMY